MPYTNTVLQSPFCCIMNAHNKRKLYKSRIYARLYRLWQWYFKPLIVKRNPSRIWFLLSNMQEVVLFVGYFSVSTLATHCSADYRKYQVSFLYRGMGDSYLTKIFDNRLTDLLQLKLWHVLSKQSRQTWNKVGLIGIWMLSFSLVCLKFVFSVI